VALMRSFVQFDGEGRHGERQTARHRWPSGRGGEGTLSTKSSG
jgi:hypothetical protein